MKSSIHALSRTARSGRCPPRFTSFPPVPRSHSSRSFASIADFQFGQPIHETHPHLLKAGELTPGITALEYAERRAKLAKALPAGSVAILAASDIKTRSGAVFYKFHQDPNFFYLTGFNEPEALAVIERKGATSEHVFHLFVRPKDPLREKWEGSRSGVEAAEDIFNADEAGDVNSVTRHLPEILSGASQVLTDIPTRAKERSTFTRMVFGSDSNKAQRFGELLQSSNAKPLQPYMNQLRAFKSEAEIANLRRAGQASGRGFTDAMRQQWDTELDLEGFLEYQFKRNGCEASAYVPVVAGGENANQIHYVRNDAALPDNMLVCADAGGEYGGYVSDITRTWPVNGKFTSAQKDLYDMILNVQRSCVSLCFEDANMSLDKLHKVADNGLREGLHDLGFDVSNDAMERLFPHHLGHYIGLDIHDCPGYPRTGNLKDGQCITIEPGIYVDNSDAWPERFRGIGIRIEDSVCVRKEGPLNLTAEAVKEVVDIEALRR